MVRNRHSGGSIATPLSGYLSGVKHVSLVVPRGEFSVTNLDFSRQLLTWVNEAAPEPPFTLDLVGLDRQSAAGRGLFTIDIDRTIAEVSRTDVILLPAVFGDPAAALADNRDLLSWMTGHYRVGSELVTMCVGAFLLAETGLLDGRRCSTHWASAADFRRRFPAVHLEEERMVTAADGIYTSGGALAFTNLLVYLVERHAGRDLAIAAAKTFMIDYDRASQAPFAVFSGQKSHDDATILAARKYIEDHFSDKLTVGGLSDRFALSRRTFERRFKRATTNTVLEYIQRTKIEAAKRDLERRGKTISEVMYGVGYQDGKAFREVFRKVVGMTPLSYRTKYGRERAYA